MTVFLNPTRDVVAKYLLDDERIRNSFIRALTPYKDIESSTKIDNALRPLKLDQNLLNKLKDPRFERFLSSDVSDLREDSDQDKMIKRFFENLYENYESIKQTLLDDKGPVSDVVCRLSTGDLILVEVQVKDPGEGVWDQRALAYAGLLYGGQLRKGEPWTSLKKLITVNILGMGQDGKRKFWPEGSAYKRHYKMKNTLAESITLPYIQLIQYSLGNTDLESIENEEERAWLDFFKTAHEKDKIPEKVSEIMRLAYSRIKSDTLPPNIKDLYASEEKELANYAVKFQEQREEGREEGKQKKAQEMAKKMLSDGLPVDTVIKYTGLSEEEIKKL